MMIIIIWHNRSMWPTYQFAIRRRYWASSGGGLPSKNVKSGTWKHDGWRSLPSTHLTAARHTDPNGFAFPSSFKKNLAKKKFLSRGCQRLQLWWPHPRPEPCLTGSPMATTKSSSVHVTKIINQKLFRQISTNNWSRSIETPTASARRFLSAWRSGAFFSEMKMTSSSKSSSQVHLFKFTRKLYEWMILMHLTC